MNNEVCELTRNQQFKNAKRRIRSFVRRDGRITLAQRKALQDYWPNYGLTVENNPLDLDKLFGRSNHKILEIGFGDGNSFLEMAEHNQDIDFIGVEVYLSGVGASLINIKKKQLSNIRVFCQDAIEVLEKAVPNNSLQGVQLFFPDPWHKKRHHKRRLIQPDFIDLLTKKIKSGGFLHIATDWEDYAFHIMNVLTKSDKFINTYGINQYAPLRVRDRPITKYEKRGQSLGHGTWDILFNRL